MAKMSAPVDLTPTLHALAQRIGEWVGEGIAQSLLDLPLGPPNAVTKRCPELGCEREVKVKGLCRNHYNLRRYHERKRQQGSQ